MTDVGEVSGSAVSTVDDRKTARLAGWAPHPPLTRDASGKVHLHSHAFARAALRAPDSEQAGFGADIVKNQKASLLHLPVLFMEGEEHAEHRRATARFFAPRTVEENYLSLMAREADLHMDRLKRDREARLDTMAMDMSVTVAAEIVGLTEHLRPGMAQRIASFLKNPPVNIPMSPTLVARIVLSQFKLLGFYLMDVRPSIRARRRTPRSDVISHLLEHGYRDREILTECVIFGAAGMVTTREFITLAALHLIERAELRERFLAADDEGQRKILEEILRLEPVIGKLYRRSTSPIDLPDGQRVEAGEHMVIDIRSANGDEKAVGGCPFHLDPDRTLADPKAGAAAMGFGDGRHRCPGAFIALQESAMFLRRLLALPGLRVVGTPKIEWNALVGGYEFHGCKIAID